ncbi:MAG TPA: hypothetical protein VGH99_11905 [Pseudonocardia sp.]|jgi:hypothetical protein
MIAALLSARLRVWLLVALGLPPLAWLLGLIGGRIEKRNGPTRVSRVLLSVRQWLLRRAGRPFAEREQEKQK